MQTAAYYLDLYRRLIGVQLRSQMQYRFSFFAESIGTMFVSGLDLLMVAILMTRFQAIGGWTLAEVMFLYGASSVSFSLAEMFVGAFDDFDKQVVQGDFDRILLKPLPVVYQMVTNRFPTRRFGRLAQGIIALVVAFSLLQPVWPPVKWGFLLVMIGAAALLFSAVLIVGATASFWSPQSHEAVNIFTYGGQFMTSYPMHIYQQWLVSLFTFIIPLAFINYYPSLYLLDKRDPLGLPTWVSFLSPLVALAAFGAALTGWRFGVRHYQSTGS